MNEPAQKAPPSAAPGGPRAFVLRFISGKYQGGEFPIVPNKEIVVGRSSELDMVLVEDMVSRKHARIQMQTDQIWIEDLGSTNGTFVNGEKVKRSRLKEGDRVLIGTSILKVIATDGTHDASGAKPVMPPPNEVPVKQTQAGSGRATMTGEIEEVPLPDLLQLFGTSKKTGILVIETDTDVGRIFLKKGNIAFATINDLQEVSPPKSIFRMLTWLKGRFALEPPGEEKFENEIDLSVQELLMEGMRQLDEFNELRSELPDMNERLVLCSPLVPALKALSPEELELVQIAYNYGHVETILNKSPSTDLDTTQLLLKLIKSNYLRRE